MRTRNQSKQQKNHDGSPGDGNLVQNIHDSEGISCSLGDISRESVQRLLSRTNSRRSTGKKKQDSGLCFSDYASMSAEGSERQDKQNIDTGLPSKTQTPVTSSPEGNVEEDNFSCALPEKKEDTDDLEWEDGFVPVPDSRDHCPNNLARKIVVEFDDSPSTSKKKPIRRASAEEKELAELLHKAHLLCLVARGRLVDSACNDPLIQASLLSLIPSYLLKIADVPKLTANSLIPLINWFHDNFRVESSSLPERSFKLCLTLALENRKGTAEEVAALSVALFRALNLTARFVSILDVASLKPDADMSGCSSNDVTWEGNGIFKSSTLMVTKPGQVSVSPIQSPSQKLGFKNEISYGSSRSVETTLNSVASKSDIDSSETCKAQAESSKRKGDLEFELQLEMALSSTATGVHESNLNSEIKDFPNSSSDLSPSLNKYKRIKIQESLVSSQGISTAVGSRKVGPPLYWAEVFCSGENLMGKWVHVDAVNAIIGGEEKVEAATSACKTTLRYVVAFAGNGAKDVTRRYCTKWYKIASKRINSQWWDAVLAPLKVLESRATGGVIPIDVQPENASNELEMVEVSKVSDYVNGTVNASTQESLVNHLLLSKEIGTEVSEQRDMSINLQSSTWDSRAVTRNSLEDMELQTRALTEPLPTNQQAYKNHHLYAIERWLTKYQMLHPKGPVLGFCSGHPVYPRTCVQKLQTKQRWLREGLQIKANESPAKVVKHSLKLGKAQTSELGCCEEDDTEGIIALYGKWQTECLDLPRAANGIVPKNERGQVDVWSEKCLPPGTVHLRLPRAVPVAKRLEIDFAPAMVGFEFRNGRSIPVFEGIVICSEFKDAIVEAYEEEEERREAEENKRNEAGAISRWYQLLSSIITRQRLKDTYGDDSSPGISHHLNQKESAHVVQTTTHGSNISHESQQGYVSKSNLTTVNEDHEHIFPVEDQSFDEESLVRTKRCPCGFLVQVEEF